MSLSFLSSPAPLTDDVTDAALLRDLAFFRHAVGESLRWAEAGVHNDFAQKVKQMQEDPMSAWLDVLQKAEAQLWQQIEGLFLDFLRAKRPLLSSAYRVQRTGVLEYVLVPLEVGLAPKFALDEILDTYAQTVLAERFPVVFHYITPGLVSDLQHVETVNLGE